MSREEIVALLGSGRLYSQGRDSLYTVDELMAGYESDAPMQSLDARLAAHVKACGIPPEDVDEAIAQVVHAQGGRSSSSTCVTSRTQSHQWQHR
jgi:hypothetical protein